MVEIGGPDPLHIMKIYSRFGLRNFILCLGYKDVIIRNYFLNYRFSRSDIALEMVSSSVEILGNAPLEDWWIVLADTGDLAQTGARIRMAAKYVRPRPLPGDVRRWLSDIAIDALYENHISDGREATETAVHLTARFGQIAIQAGQVTMFPEKPQVTDGWVNGGFFVFDRSVFDDAEFFARSVTRASRFA